MDPPKPPEKCKLSISIIQESHDSHPASFLCQGLDHQLPVFLSPPTHPWVRANKVVDIVNNVLILSSLILKCDVVDCKGIQNVSDVNLGPTGDTKITMWKLHF